jgi:hypothetical protein
LADVLPDDEEWRLMTTARGMIAVAAATLAITALCACAADAQASTTLGQTSNNTGDWFTAFPFTEIQTGSAGPPSYTVPSGGGVITSWSNQADAAAAGFMQLKVFQPTAQPDQFKVIAESALEPIASGQLDTFPTHLQVQAGDVLGYSRPAGTWMSSFFFTENAGDTLAQAPGHDDPVGGVTSVGPSHGGARLNISAILQQAPAITSLSASSGPSSGGTAIAINGHDFAGATAVAFGSIPAVTFTVDSDSQINATTPPSASIGAVDVSVTTALGTTSPEAADRFTYTACLVPELKGKTLKASRKKLKKADCKLGEVKKLKGATATRGRIVRQSPRPGKVLAPGAQVDVRLGQQR